MYKKIVHCTKDLHCPLIFGAFLTLQKVASTALSTFVPSSRELVSSSA